MIKKFRMWKDKLTDKQLNKISLIIPFIFSVILTSISAIFFFNGQGINVTSILELLIVFLGSFSALTLLVLSVMTKKKST